MHKERERNELQKVKTRTTEIVHAEGKIGKHQIRIVLVYMKRRNYNEAKIYNEKIMDKIGEILEEKEIQQIATILLGDLNGHLGGLGN